MKEASIGQMARLNRLSEANVRLYDKAGIFFTHAGMRKMDTIL